MGLFDLFVKKASGMLEEKTEEINQKVNDFQKKLTTDPFELLNTKKSAPKTQSRTAKGKAAPPKPDLSIEGISKQILLQRDSIRKNGFKEYEFITNRNCCEVCARLNGKHFPISALKIGVNAPPMHEGCSCSIAAYEDRQAYEDWLNSL